MKVNAIYSEDFSYRLPDDYLKQSQQEYDKFVAEAQKENISKDSKEYKTY